jgi:hypothetical protein
LARAMACGRTRWMELEKFKMLRRDHQNEEWEPHLRVSVSEFYMDHNFMENMIRNYGLSKG